jgi:hypothetical protein
MSDTFRITVALHDDEYDGDRVDVSRVPGLREQDLPEVQKLLPGTQLSTEPGEVGRGAAGPGATLVIEVIERVVNDGGSLLAWGTAFLPVIRRLRGQHGRTVDLDDPGTVAAVTAAQVPTLHDRLAGSRFISSTRLGGGDPGAGTDVRDVWVSTFATDDGWWLMLFSSPTGLVLGDVAVPGEWSGHGVRTPEQVRELFNQANRPGTQNPEQAP